MNVHGFIKYSQNTVNVTLNQGRGVFTLQLTPPEEETNKITNFPFP